MPWPYEIPNKPRATPEGEVREFWEIAKDIAGPEYFNPDSAFSTDASRELETNRAPQEPNGDTSPT